MTGSGGDLLDILKQVPAIPGYVLTAAQVVRWAFRRYRAWDRGRRPPARALIEHRIRMRDEIEKNMRRYPRRPGAPPTEPDSFEEIIVRDVKRLDAFPELRANDVGISPWLKLEVNGLFHRGIEVFLSDVKKAIPIADDYGSLEEWRFILDGESCDEAINAVPIGRIPFDFIERIDWSRSDEYYYAPHFYVRFAGALRMPYEGIIYKGILYPDVSRTYHEMRGLKPDYATWSAPRRGFFLLRQDARRLWRRLVPSKGQ